MKLFTLNELSNIDLAEKLEGGFLHIADIIHKHTPEHPIFEVKEESYEDILRKLQSQELKNGVVIDLRLGAEYFLSGEKYAKKLSEAYPYLTINSGEFALLTTYEIIHVPKDLIGFISMRFSKKSGGLINISGFHVDPGYNGIIIFSVYNAGPKPLTLEFKDDVFMITFSRISKPVNEPIKTYQNQMRLSPKHWAHLVGNQPVSVMSLDTRISKLENWNKLTVGLAIALGGTILTLALTAVFNFLQSTGD